MDFIGRKGRETTKKQSRERKDMKRNELHRQNK
jgi:hypothetical protein